MTDTIAFIGLGAMGLPMASNLVRKGFPVIGFDLDRAKLDALVAVGAKPAGSLADAVREAGIVITMLPAPPHVRSVMLGPDGVLAHLRTGGLVIDMSTIDPATTDDVADACRRKGQTFVDAPVGRLVSHAERGESLFMVGASDEGHARALPLLQAMGTTILRCGPEGSGTRTKIVNNYLAIVGAQLTAEALLLGTKLGLNVATMRDVAGGTTATNGQLMINFPSKVLKGDTAPGFTIDLAHKDLMLALAAASQQRLGLPVGQAAASALGAARGSDYAGRDFSALLDYACEIAGVAPPRLSPQAS
ncbi:4-hydroxybutyrate dehydrogenase/sulfolactaldehyde 3-reductase [Nitrospirillum amazonense]|uniref:4-hydroxybutyrate dehydrogenase/sulfolactaldehyde 3-reductase n=1 Tax=Nitrospirillum amazonense TaxID=28077 RepID=A0A560F9Z6_9PROT|nr:NAD(P)-dependent oxidoreductase [Nitrospirillum amazonense]TWB18420.1 4-hydroxybutyrate dehydrogenase/sulfolactaldehyde 3-reductase [Nitrospirillum amazonense]